MTFIRDTSYFSPIARLDISLYVCSHCFSLFEEMNFSLLPVNNECKHLQIQPFPFLLGCFSLRHLYYCVTLIANSFTVNTNYFLYWFLFHKKIFLRIHHVTYESTVITGNKNVQLVLQPLPKSDVGRFITYPR